MSLETKLLLIVMCILAFSLVMAVGRVLAAWAEHHLARHDLIVASKQKRLDYLRSLAEREKAEQNGVLEDDETGNVIIEADEPANLAQAA